METLFAIAVAVAALKAHAPQPAEPPRTVIALERREIKVDKSRPRRTGKPLLGF